LPPFSLELVRSPLLVVTFSPLPPSLKLLIDLPEEGKEEGSVTIEDFFPPLQISSRSTLTLLKILRFPIPFLTKREDETNVESSVHLP